MMNRGLVKFPSNIYFQHIKSFPLFSCQKAFHSPAKLLFLIGRKENSRQISSCLHSVAKRVRKNQKVHIIIAQLTIYNVVICLISMFSSSFEPGFSI